MKSIKTARQVKIIGNYITTMELPHALITLAASADFLKKEGRFTRRV